MFTANLLACSRLLCRNFRELIRFSEPIFDDFISPVYERRLWKSSRAFPRRWIDFLELFRLFVEVSARLLTRLSNNLLQNLDQISRFIFRRKRATPPLSPHQSAPLKVCLSGFIKFITDISLQILFSRSFLNLLIYIETENWFLYCSLFPLRRLLLGVFIYFIFELWSLEISSLFTLFIYSNPFTFWFLMVFFFAPNYVYSWKSVVLIFSAIPNNTF